MAVKIQEISDRKAVIVVEYEEDIGSLVKQIKKCLLTVLKRFYPNYPEECPKLSGGI